MRIMIVTDQYPPMVGGVPTVTRDLAVDLAHRGHQVWIVAPSHDTRDLRLFEHKVQIYRFSSFEWPTYQGLRIAFLPFMPIRNLIKESDPDIIHIHSPGVLGNIAQVLAGWSGKPTIATNHYLPINMCWVLAVRPLIGKHFSNVAYSYLMQFYNRCAYVTVPTKTALELLHDHGLHAPARTISNGIDLKKFTPGERNSHILQRYNLPEDRPLVIHANRLSEEKRIDVLLDAAARMRNNATIALVGTGPMEAKLRAQADKLNLGDRIRFLGPVSDADLLALRRSSEIFVIPSEADLQSLSTMEAMACGLPVIAANAYALPELVHHDKNGLLFQPGNSDELARYLDILLNNANLRAHMGKESLKIIVKHDRLGVLEEWEELYCRLSIEFKGQFERAFFIQNQRV
jgi:phosphatidylinositol alpha 1,6-mannosyltransferase